MKEEVYKGWIGRSMKNKKSCHWRYGQFLDTDIYRRKGNKEGWHSEDWPPDPVEIIVRRGQ